MDSVQNSPKMVVIVCVDGPIIDNDFGVGSSCFSANQVVQALLS